jgi:hypothetical protein
MILKGLGMNILKGASVLVLAVASIAFSAGLITQPLEVSVLSYGAVGDGETMTSKAIQAAIDDCHARGGGTVIVPAGNYVCGTILHTAICSCGLQLHHVFSFISCFFSQMNFSS